MKDSVNILGTRYTVIHATGKECPKLDDADADGLCEVYAKKIIVRKSEEDKANYENIEEYEKKVTRHEIIHAFLSESGLRDNCDYANDEELIDWLAIQFSKIHRAMCEVGCLEKVT